MGFSRVKVDEERSRAHTQLTDVGEIVEASSQPWLQQIRPNQVSPSVAPALEVSQEAVDNVRFGAEEIDGIHFGIGLSTVFDALDSCKVALLAEELRGDIDAMSSRQRLTRNIAVEDVVRFDSIVYNLLGIFVHYQAFPLWFAAVCVSISVDCRG